MSETKDIHGYCTNLNCVNYNLISTYPEGFCEICERKILPSRRLFMDQQLIDLHAEGLNDQEIADALKVHKSTVRYHRRKLGLKPSFGRLFTDQQLIELCGCGLSDQEIGEKLGANRSTVKDHRIRLGIKSSRPCVDHHRFLKFYGKGLNDPEIADALGVKDSMVYAYRKRHGLGSNWRKPLFTDQQLIDLYEKGLHDREIAEELGSLHQFRWQGVTKFKVKVRRQKLGLKAHDRKRLFSDQQLIDLHAQGLNDREKAESLGVSEGAVYYHLRKLGLKMKER